MVCRVKQVEGFERMLFRGLVALVLTGGAAWAEPIEGRALALGCEIDGCRLAFAGVVLTVSDGSPAAASLRGLAQIEAVEIAGDLTFLGDISGTADLTAVAVLPDDPVAALLRDLQGEWQYPDAAEPVGLSVTGVEWTEFSVGNEVLGSYVMTLGSFCADGSEPGGAVLSLRRMAGDPEEVGCFTIDGLVGAQMRLRGATPAIGDEIWERAVD